MVQYKLKIELLFDRSQKRYCTFPMAYYGGNRGVGFGGGLTLQDRHE